MECFVVDICSQWVPSAHPLIIHSVSTLITRPNYCFELLVQPMTSTSRSTISAIANVLHIQCIHALSVPNYIFNRYTFAQSCSATESVHTKNQGTSAIEDKTFVHVQSEDINLHTLSQYKKPLMRNIVPPVVQSRQTSCYDRCCIGIFSEVDYPEYSILVSVRRQEAPDARFECVDNVSGAAYFTLRIPEISPFSSRPYISISDALMSILRVAPEARFAAGCMLQFCCIADK
jgi:hypothetical protein